MKNSAVLIIVNSLVISAKSKPHFWYLDKVFHVKLPYFNNFPFIVHVQTAQSSFTAIASVTIEFKIPNFDEKYTRYNGTPISYFLNAQ